MLTIIKGLPLSFPRRWLWRYMLLYLQYLDHHTFPPEASRGQRRRAREKVLRRIKEGGPS